MKNDYFLFIGIVFLSVGILDFFHLLSYKGMNIFTAQDSNIPTQLWILGRYLLAFSLLIAPNFIKNKLNLRIVLPLYIFITAFIVAGTFWLKIFPVSYIEGSGLTPFKKISEWVICLIFIVSIVKLRRLKDHIDLQVFRLIYWSIILSIITDGLFSLYVGVYDAFNLAGHMVRLLSYYFVYKAIIDKGLKEPYRIMFFEIDRLSRQKDEFISVASHEIRNPLTVIKVYAQILGRKYAKKKDRRDLQAINHIDSQVDKINKLISDMSDANRIESGKLTLNFRHFNLGMLLKRVVSDIKKVYKDHRITFEGKIISYILGDESRITQVFSNLITNAIKYSPNNTRIIVSVNHSKNDIVVSVRDSGIGIPKDEIPFIFDKYFRTKSGTKRTDGLGLGLYLTKEIITRHHGRIWVESKVNQGSTFYVSLPLIHKKSSRTK